MDVKTMIELENRINKARKLETSLGNIKQILRDFESNKPILGNIQFTYTETTGWGSDEEREIISSIDINASILGLTEQEFTHCFYKIIKEKLNELKILTYKEYLEV